MGSSVAVSQWGKPAKYKVMWPTV